MNGQDDKGLPKWALIAIALIVVAGIILTVYETYLVGRFRSGAGGLGSLLAILVGALVGGGIYFIPTYVAYQRNHHNKEGIGILNLALGWTLIGWVVCLVWAVSESVKVRAEDPPAADFKKCPYCAEQIRSEAVKCRYCGSALTA